MQHFTMSPKIYQIFTVISVQFFCKSLGVFVTCNGTSPSTCCECGDTFLELVPDHCSVVVNYVRLTVPRTTNYLLLPIALVKI